VPIPVLPISATPFTGAIPKSGSGGLLANGFINWAAPSAIGGTTPAAGAFSSLVVDTNVLVVDAVNNRVGINNAAPSFPLGLGQQVGNRLALYDNGDGTGYGFGVQSLLLQILTPTSGARVGIGHGTSDAFTEVVTIQGGSNNGFLGLGTGATFTSPIAGTDHFKVTNGTSVFGFNYNSNQPFFEVSDGTRKAFGGHVNPTDGAVFGSFTDHGLALRTNNVNRLIISNAGVTTLRLSDAVTNAVTNVGVISHNSSGTPAASFGTGLLLQGESSTTENVDMARIRALWTTATHASRVSNLVLSVYNVASEVDVLTLTPTGMSTTLPISGASSGIILNSGGNNFLSRSSNVYSFRAAAAGTFLQFQNNSGTTLLSLDNSGQVVSALLDAGTNSVGDAWFIRHNSSGTPTTNFGIGVVLQGESDTTDSQNMARLRTFWTTATHASRTARGVLSAFDTAERDCIMWEASGSAAMIGFLGTAPTVRQTGYTTFSNLATDRTCDANATTVEELADILGTLIEDLKVKGLIAA
jgi:hypothetical protein